MAKSSGIPVDLQEQAQIDPFFLSKVIMEDGT
jgi:hypothetical protein